MQAILENPMSKRHSLGTDTDLEMAYNQIWANEVQEKVYW